MHAKRKTREPTREESKKSMKNEKRKKMTKCTNVVSVLGKSIIRNALAPQLLVQQPKIVKQGMGPLRQNKVLVEGEAALLGAGQKSASPFQRKKAIDNATLTM